MLDLENNESLENRIELYVKGEMTTQERNDFEVEIAHDTYLALEVKRRQQLLFVLENESTLEAFHMMKNIMETAPPPLEYNQKQTFTRTYKNLSGLKKLGVFTLSAFIIALSVYLFLPKKTTINQAEINNLLNTFKVPYINKIKEIPPQTALERGMNAYLEADYRIAIRELKFQAKNEPSVLAIQFYLGLSYFLDEKPKEAIPIFKKIIAESPIFKEPSEWYLSLIYVASKDYEKAQPLLENLKNTRYEENANQLLELLSNKK